jgi:hypothetical protein
MGGGFDHAQQAYAERDCGGEAGGDPPGGRAHVVVIGSARAILNR